MRSPIPPWTEDKLTRLIHASRFLMPVNVWIHSAKVLNVYTGEVLPWNIGILEERIAYVGEKKPLTNDHTEIINGAGYTIVPGYIEPHSHPFQIYHPFTLGEFALKHGTTTLVHDNMRFYLHLTEKSLERFYEDAAYMPVKNFWWARLDPQNNSEKMKALFTSERIEKLLGDPATLQAGELTGWLDIVGTESNMMKLMTLARNSGKRIEAHNPGASHETLATMAAAGVSGCHESITAEEVIRRLRLGMAATLRHSSIRPDLPVLIQGLLNVKGFEIPWNRLMLTTDGSPPFFLEQGFIDVILKVAMDAGLDPIRAYQMATLNPATYYGLDAHIGGIAPGRIADLVFLNNLNEPTPVHVMTNGKMTVHSEELIDPFPKPKWNDYQTLNSQTVLSDIFKVSQDEKTCHDDFFIETPILETSISDGSQKDMTKMNLPYLKSGRSAAFPVMSMLNAAILKEEWMELPIKDGTVEFVPGDDLLYASLIDRDRKWITNGVLKGFGEIDALASTFTISQGVVVLGRDRLQMTEAVDRVRSTGGGICLMEKGEPIFQLPLPLLSGMSDEPMDVLIRETSQLVQLLHERGYRHEDPFYTLLFLSATHLPALRLTANGLLSVKANQIIIPAKKILNTF